MTDRRRRRIRSLPAERSAEVKTPIDAAIDAAEANRVAAEQAGLEPRTVARLPLLHGLHRWDGRQEVVVGAVPGDNPTLLVWDRAQGAWRAVVLPDDSRWRVVPDRPALWRPR